MEHYGASALRYYLMRDVVMGRDADFSEERLLSRYHSELSNGLGNLLNRTVSMIHRYRPEGLYSVPLPEECEQLLSENRAFTKKYCEEMEASQIQSGLEEMVAIINRANAFVDTTAPWKIAKTLSSHSTEAAKECVAPVLAPSSTLSTLSCCAPSTPSPSSASANVQTEFKDSERLDAVLITLVQSTRLAATLLMPVAPLAATAILEQLCLEAFSLVGKMEFSSLPSPYIPGAPKPLFPRIES